MILHCLTDDVFWKCPACIHTMEKKNSTRKSKMTNFVGSPTIQIKRFVEENNIVIAEGAVQGKMKNGNSLDAVFCDVFEMTGGKIRCLTSYLMTLNTSIKFE
jgi:uncharacterized protein